MDYVDVIFAHRADITVPMVRERALIPVSIILFVMLQEEVVRAFNFVIEKGWVREMFHNVVLLSCIYVGSVLGDFRMDCSTNRRSIP